eukprot:6184134-Pleurochrysis_carterae.AAC.1
MQSAGKHASGGSNSAPDRLNAGLNVQGHAAANRNENGRKPQPECKSCGSAMRVMMQKLKQWCLSMQNIVIQARSFANLMMLMVSSGSTATWASLNACRAVVARPPPLSGARAM